MQGPYDIRLIHPSTHLVVGATGSGKTQYISKLLGLRSEIFSPPPQKIIMFYAQWQDSYDSMKESGAVDEFYLGVPDQLTFNNLIVGKSTVVLFDDLFHAFGQNSLDINLLFKVQSHHENCSPFIIVHRAFGSNIRDLSLNCLYYHQLYSARDIGQLSELSRQAFGRGASNFLPACIRRQAQLRGFAHLMINFHPRLSNNILMVLANIFRENERHITVYSRVTSNCKMSEVYRELYLLDSKEVDILRRKAEIGTTPVSKTVNQISAVLTNGGMTSGSRGEDGAAVANPVKAPSVSVDGISRNPPPVPPLPLVNHLPPKHHLQPSGGHLTSDLPQNIIHPEAAQTQQETAAQPPAIPPIKQLFNKKISVVKPKRRVLKAVGGRSRAGDVSLRHTPYPLQRSVGGKVIREDRPPLPPGGVEPQPAISLPRAPRNLNMNSWETIEPEAASPRGGKMPILRKIKRVVPVGYFERGLKRQKIDLPDDNGESDEN